MMLHILECTGRPATKNYPAQSVNSAMTEKTYSTSCIFKNSGIDSGNKYVMARKLLRFWCVQSVNIHSVHEQIYIVYLWY